MQEPQLYILGSILIGLIILIETIVLYRTAGKPPKQWWFMVMSAADFVWFIVSIWAVFSVDLDSVSQYARVVPALYIIYTVFGWIYGTKLLKKSEQPLTTDNLTIPPAYLAYSLSFAILFIVLSTIVLVAAKMATAL